MTEERLPTADEIDAKTLFERVPVGEIFVDQAYGRALDESNLRRILREWDERALGVALLSLRNDGRYAVIDGQHRIEAAKKMGVLTIPARVYIDLTPEEEAKLYRLFGIHKAQTPLDRFRASIQERVPAALRIRAIILGMGLEISAGSVGDGKVTAMASVTRLYGQYGPEMLELVLRTLYASFGRDYRAYSGTMITGLAAFVVRFEPWCDWTRLVRRLQEEGLSELSQRVLASKRAFSAGGSSNIIIGRIIHDVYNKRAQNKLAPFEDKITPTKNMRMAIIGPEIRLSQRKALATVPHVYVDTDRTA